MFCSLGLRKFSGFAFGKALQRIPWGHEKVMRLCKSEMRMNRIAENQSVDRVAERCTGLRL